MVEIGFGVLSGEKLRPGIELRRVAMDSGNNTPCAHDVSPDCVAKLESHESVPELSEASQTPDATTEEPIEAPVSRTHAFFEENPQLSVDELRGELWELAADPTPAADNSEAGRFVECVRQEANEYQSRLKRQEQQLTERLGAQVAHFLCQIDELRSQFKEDCEKIDEQIVAVAARPRRTRPLQHSVNVSSTNHLQTVDSADAVIRFWKLKCSQLSEALDATSDERLNVVSRIDDLRRLNNPNHFHAIEVLGQLRSNEIDLLELANGYAHLLEEVHQTKDTGTPSDADKDRIVRDRFTTIERRIVDAEEEALRAMQAAADSRVRGLRNLLSVLGARAEILECRAGELQSQTKAAPEASLDRTLQLAMDLRTKTGSLPDAIDSSLDKRKHADAEAALREEIRQYQQLAADEDDAMRKELREKRVKVIRTIHSSGGDVDARFEHVRAQQHASAIGQQVATAESDRAALKLRLASLTGQAQRNIDFLSRCTV